MEPVPDGRSEPDNGLCNAELITAQPAWKGLIDVEIRDHALPVSTAI